MHLGCASCNAHPRCIHLENYDVLWQPAIDEMRISDFIVSKQQRCVVFWKREAVEALLLAAVVGPVSDCSGSAAQSGGNAGDSNAGEEISASMVYVAVGVSIFSGC